MDRRKFLERIAAAVAVTAPLANIVKVPETKAAIKSSMAKSAALKTPKTARSEIRDIPINLTDNPDLKPVGGTYHLELDDLERDILVVHYAPEKYTAVDIKCTHRACDLSYDTNAKDFYCPCHGSKFDLYGRVTNGPADRPLNYYHAERQGDEVVVTVYQSGDEPPANSIPPPADTVPSSGFIQKDSTVRSDTTASQPDTAGFH